MDEGKLIAEFIAANIENIWSLGKTAYGKIDSTIQIKLKTAYTDYLQNIRLKYSKSKSFFIRHQPAELYTYYVPTGIGCGKHKIDHPDFGQCASFTNRIIITGTGGSGKSILMKHLFLDCIAANKYVPILIELRDLNGDEKKLDDYINEVLNDFGFDTDPDYVRKAKEAGHFAFFFDGYDEVVQKKRKKLITQIKSLSKKYPQCPIIMTSRPTNTCSIQKLVVFGL